MPEVRGRGGTSGADGASGGTEADRRARELGAAMLNAARPYIDVKLNKEGHRWKSTGWKSTKAFGPKVKPSV
jgi:hypothetical protein